MYASELKFSSFKLFMYNITYFNISIFKTILKLIFNKYNINNVHNLKSDKKDIFIHVKVGKRAQKAHCIATLKFSIILCFKTWSMI